jgi:hypothetical protein
MPPPRDDTRGAFLADALAQFRKYRALAEAALAQVDDAAFCAPPGPDGNSLALLVKHVAGNQRSRWTDFLTTDGEKPDRRRDGEFELQPGDTRVALMARWDDGWRRLFAAVEPLAQADLSRTVAIRGEAHSVLQAIARQQTHYAYHVGQIVALARHHAGAHWRSLSIPRGQSAAWEVGRDGAPYRPSSSPSSSPPAPPPA